MIGLLILANRHHAVLEVLTPHGTKTAAARMRDAIDPPYVCFSSNFNTALPKAARSRVSVRIT
ncbi:MAG: hypothetical protein Q8K27_01420, partial [Betaproteobacteria bacterium]|nr:hypothetical protein [Betaproteobacteria bacterium]